MSYSLTVLTLRNKLLRLLWQLVWLLFFRPTPVFAHSWRRFLLRCFGAKIGSGVHPYPSVRIWAPWNLIMKENSCLGSFVDCYNVSPITIGKGSIVSQYSYLCTASHDYSTTDFNLLSSAIDIGDFAWIAADVFVSPGIRIGEGCVILARSNVFSDTEPWMVYKGNPAVAFKARHLIG